MYLLHVYMYIKIYIDKEMHRFRLKLLEKRKKYIYLRWKLIHILTNIYIYIYVKKRRKKKEKKRCDMILLSKCTYIILQAPWVLMMWPNILQSFIFVYRYWISNDIIIYHEPSGLLPLTHCYPSNLSVKNSIKTQHKKT